MLALDSNWFSRLEDTRWMAVVATCLQAALQVIEVLVDKSLTVVIKGELIVVVLNLWITKILTLKYDSSTKLCTCVVKCVQAKNVYNFTSQLQNLEKLLSYLLYFGNM